MFVLLKIEKLDANADGLPANTQHIMTCKVSFSLYDVPDSFTACVYKDEQGDLKLEHFNKPKGNRRKMFTLKNKLAPGSFKEIEKGIFAFSQAESIGLPLEVQAKKLSSRTMGG